MTRVTRHILIAHEGSSDGKDPGYFHIRGMKVTPQEVVEYMNRWLYAMEQGTEEILRLDPSAPMSMLEGTPSVLARLNTPVTKCKPDPKLRRATKAQRRAAAAELTIDDLDLDL